MSETENTAVKIGRQMRPVTQPSAGVAPALKWISIVTIIVFFIALYLKIIFF